MPTTVNGIGTHYYGKKNILVRADICRSCGKYANLTSYDTRLWFVIIFIPVIPLGRKRITDQCSNCNRHWAADRDKWDMARQLGVSGAMEKYRAAPTPESALELHASFLAFRMVDEAQKFRTEAEQQHAASPVFFAGMAAQLQEFGHPADAIPLFEKAYALRPEMPEARIGMAQQLMRKGQLDEARKLLDFLEQPGVGQSYDLSPLEELAHHYQKARRHSETLELCKRLLDEFPRVGQIQTFRKFVAVSEKAMAAHDSILPQRSFSLGKLFDSKSGEYSGWQRALAIGGTVALLVSACLVLHNEYRRRHRTLYVMNDLPQPAEVSVDDQPPVQVAGLAPLTVAEGKHHIKIAGPVADDFEVEVSSGYFERWTKSPGWIVNVGGASALVFSTVHYAAHPVPPEVQFLVGERFHAIPHVDYLFEEPPDKLQTKSKGGEITKTHLDRIVLPASDLFHYLFNKGNRQGAVQFAEAHLREDQQNYELLTEYARAMKSSEHAGRAEKFLYDGRASRPVSIVWHRALMELQPTAEQEAALSAEYDAELKKSPKDAPLLYLRGRVAPNRDETLRYYQQSVDADSKLGWAWYGLSTDAAGNGDWAKAAEFAGKLAGINPQVREWEWTVHLARLGSGKAAEIGKEYGQQVDTLTPNESSRALIFLCDALAAQGKPGDARKYLDGWVNRIPAESRASENVQVLRSYCLYTLGDTSAMSQTLPNATQPSSHEYLVSGLAALGRPEEAAKHIPTDERQIEPKHLLEVSVAFAIAGNGAAAADWRKRACTRLDKENRHSRLIAAALRSDQPPTVSQLQEIILSPGNKALILTALAQRFPDRKSELVEQARRLNVSRIPPYLLVEKALQSIK